MLLVNAMQMKMQMNVNVNANVNANVCQRALTEGIRGVCVARASG